MAISLIEMATTTVSLITFCILGVTGAVSGVEVYEDAIAFESPYFSISIGGFVVGPEFMWAHEYGHVLQNRQLGAAYLPVVGLPSITMNVLTRLGLLPYQDYYNRWPETWANDLGGNSW
jgi:hypothetical protein